MIQVNVQYMYFSLSATIKISPCRASLSQLQLASSKDIVHVSGRGGSAFQFTYQPNEKWLKILMSFSQPVLLSAIHIYQPQGHSQSKQIHVHVHMYM